MQDHSQAASFASPPSKLFTSIANMLARNLWLLCALATFAFVATTASPAFDQSASDQEDAVLKSFFLRKKSLGRKKLEPADGAGVAASPESETILRRVKLVRTREKTKDPRNGARDTTADGGHEGTEIQRDGNEGRFKRNATALNEFKGSKKGHKKLKLAQAQAGHKNRKSKDLAIDWNGEKLANKAKKNVDHRVDRFVDDNAAGSRSKRSGGSYGSDRNDYYAQRKAVMERFYARQKEIADKYAKKAANGFKYIHRQDSPIGEGKSNFSASNRIEKNDGEKIENATNRSDDGFENSGRISATTEASTDAGEITPEGNREERTNSVPVVENSSDNNVEGDASDDYDYYTIEDNKGRQTSDAMLEDNGTLNDGEWETGDNRRDTLKWGDCSGKLVYQHNLIIGVHRAALADADLITSLEGPFCITCIRVVPANANKVRVSLDVNRGEDGSLVSAKLRFNGFQDEELSYMVKIWAAVKENNRCDHVRHPQQL